MALLDTANFIIRIGDDFIKELVFTDATGERIDLTDYSFKMQLRRTKCGTLVYELESPDSIDISQAADGIIFLNIPADATALFEEQNTIFDLIWVTNLLITTTILKGNIQILQRVTR